MRSLWILVNTERTLQFLSVTDTLYVGLMRLNECQQVKETLQEHLGINLTIVDGSELFFSRLAGVTEPERKRKIIGETCQSPLIRMQASFKKC